MCGKEKTTEDKTTLFSGYILWYNKGATLRR
jgi:hypothetical protein